MKVFKSILKVVMLVITIHFHLAASAQSEAAIKHFDEGRAYYNKNEYDYAIISFTEAIKLYPDYSSAYN